MRVLFITNLFPPVVLGGYELACANVARSMATRGHDVRVLTTWSHLPVPEDEPDWVRRILDLHWYVPHKSRSSVVNEYDLHSAGCSSYANTLRLLETLREFEPDIVYVWNSFGLGAAALFDLLNQVGVPWAYHLMDRMPTEILAHAPKFVLGLFDAQDESLYAAARILAMSEHLVDEIKCTSGVTFPQGVEFVPGWADLTGARPHEPYLRNGIARFVIAGSVMAHKGIDLILEASARLKAFGLAFSVDVYGDGELAAYVDKSRGLQVNDRVRFLGPRSQPELLQRYAEYDAFLFPTWEREPFGFAPIEAAGCATPPIMTGNCGAAERLVNGVHCIKIERTADALTDSMREVATGGIDVARIGRASQRLVATDLSLGHCVEQIERALQSHCRVWAKQTLHDPKLALLAFLKHNLSVSLRFG